MVVVIVVGFTKNVYDVMRIDSLFFHVKVINVDEGVEMVLGAAIRFSRD